MPSPGLLFDVLLQHVIDLILVVLTHKQTKDYGYVLLSQVQMDCSLKMHQNTPEYFLY